jgi:uncharacterized protein
MTGETNLATLLKTAKPEHNVGEYVFCRVTDAGGFPVDEVVMIFKEAEGVTLIVRKEWADSNQLEYSFVSAWITLTVHSSLAVVGLTAAFSTALASAGISCNVVAAYYHDHIFVDTRDLARAMDVLRGLGGDGQMERRPSNVEY